MRLFGAERSPDGIHEETVVKVGRQSAGWEVPAIHGGSTDNAEVKAAFAPARALQAKNPVVTVFFGAGGGNRTRDSCLEGKGITTMQRPRIWAGLDLNQRSAFAHQVYSLAPLTTRPPTRVSPLQFSD